MNDDIKNKTQLIADELARQEQEFGNPDEENASGADAGGVDLDNAYKEVYGDLPRSDEQIDIAVALNEDENARKNIPPDGSDAGTQQE